MLSRKRARAASLALVLVTAQGLLAGAELSLEQAERLALERDPLLAAATARGQALREQAVSDGQLADPRLRFGLLNFPTDTFDRSQEPMTQVLVGVQQTFPRGRTLAFRRQQAESLARVEEARAQDQRFQIVRAVRESYLEVYYQVEALRIIAASRRLFSQLAEITRAQYTVGRANQQDVLQAQLELSRLEDRATSVQEQEDTARAELTKWIAEPAQQPLPVELARLPMSPPVAEIESSLISHPAMLAEGAQVQAGIAGIRIVREQYKPGWTLDLSYGARTGDNLDGSERADFLSAVASVDLPLFTEKRQDRRLAASQQQAAAARYGQADRLRELRRMLHRAQAQWQRLGERQALFHSQLLPEAQANAEASLNAYQSGVTEFTTLMRARITELELRLQERRLSVDRAKAQARLLYLVGED